MNFKRDAQGLRFWERDILGRKSMASATELAPLCRQISFMLNAGVSLKAIMTVLTESPGTSRSRRKNRILKTSLRSALESIMSGESLALALERPGYFPVFMCRMCRIGELSGNLPKVMELLSDYYEERSRNRDEIMSALLYPAVVSAMMFAMILVAVFYVLPNHALLFDISDEPLPAITQGLLSFSAFIINSWFLIVPFLILSIAAPMVFVRTEWGRFLFESALLRIPLYRQMVNLHIIQALALLLKSGQPLSDSTLAASGIMTNKIVAGNLQQVSVGLQQGAAFWILLGDFFYMDPAAVSMAKVGEETGNMSLAFEYASEYSRHRFRQMSRQFNKMVEPAITLVMGLLLAIVMLAIILPAFAMTDLAG